MKKELNSRAYGESLETYVIDKFADFGIDVKQFKNSGAENPNDSDLNHSHIQLECKRNGLTDTKGNSYPKFKIKDWQRIIKEARSRNKMPGLVISGDKVNSALIVLKLEDFAKIFAEFLPSEK